MSLKTYKTCIICKEQAKYVQYFADGRYKSWCEKHGKKIYESLEMEWEDDRKNDKRLYEVMEQEKQDDFFRKMGIK